MQIMQTAPRTRATRKLMTERFGIYFAPSTDSEFWKLGSKWLGRDCARGNRLDHPSFKDLNAELLHKVTKSPRRYGLHATIKAPMGLAKGYERDDLQEALSLFAQNTVPKKIGRLKLKAIGRFLALVPENQTSAVESLAANVVQEFDGFRAPLSQEKRAERIAAGLSAQQTELLDKWGYPYVMDQFRMHITLTNSLNEKEGPIVLRAAQKWFAPILEIEHSFDRFCLYKESAPGAPFERIADYKFQASTNETRP